jgi:type IV pilus assembly protein PilE
VKRHQHGVTLLELMAVVVIIGILAAIAIPSYRTYVMRAQRAEATAMLLRVAAAQEKFYLQNNSYTTTLGDTGLRVIGTGTATERGWYNISIAAPAGFTIANAYTATATAVAGQAQAKDTPCQTFTIRETGERGSSPSAMATCWR